MLKNSLDPQRLEEEIRTNKNQLESINDDIKMVSDRLENEKAKLKAQLEKSGFTRRMLDTLTQLSNALDRYNIDFSEVYNLARVIEEFKKLRRDAKIIIARYEQEQNLESAIKKLESKMEQYETVLEDLHRKRTGQNIQVAEHYDAFHLY
jgi:uncharacterized protein YukE